MTSSTLVWDVSSGLILGIVCILLAKDLYCNLKRENVASDLVTASFLVMIMLFCIGAGMLGWALFNLGSAWLVLTW